MCRFKKSGCVKTDGRLFVDMYGAFSLRVLTRVDGLNWRFNQALIQVLHHPRKADTFEMVHARHAR